MQKDINTLEKELAEAKKQEYLVKRIKELEEIKKEYEGKCFGSNLFNRMHKSRYFGAVYYEKFFIKENEVWVTQWTLSGSRYPSFYKSETPTYQLNSHIYEKNLTSKDSDYSAIYNLFNGYSFYRKEISKEEFMSLWSAARECYLIISDTFKKSPQLEIEDVRQGDHSNEQTIDRVIDELGLDIIDLKNFPKMFWIFEYKTLPMLQNGRYIPRIYAKQLMEYTIKQLEKEKKDMYSTVRSINWCNERISTIKQFIKEELCQKEK